MPAIVNAQKSDSKGMLNMETALSSVRNPSPSISDILIPA